jgi:hypothetical protein
MSKVVVRLSTVRFQQKGLAIAGGGFLVQALELLSDAQVVMKLGIIGARLDGSTNPRDAFLMSTGLVGKYAQHMQRWSVGRIAQEQEPADFFCLPGLAGLEQLPSRVEGWGGRCHAKLQNDVDRFERVFAF